MHGRIVPIVAVAAALAAVPLCAAGADRPVVRFDPSALPGAPATRSTVDGPPATLVSIVGTRGALPVYACGVIVAEHRDTIVIATAAHVAAIEHVAFVAASGERLRIRSVTTIPGHDLALVTADRPWRWYAVARSAPVPALGARVRLWGPVGGEPFTPHDAVVRAMDPRVTDAPAGAFALDCPACAHGDSGTGVFNARDELVGIVTAGYAAGATRILVLSERYPGEAP